MRRLICFAACLIAANGYAADVADPNNDSFDVWEYRVLGNTVLSPADIETAVYPKLGPGRTLADVEEVRTTLEKLYRDRGFGAVFVDIPEQEVNSGIVRIKVTEGRLSRVRISGARYFSNGRIREALPALTPGDVLELPELQQQLNALNRQSPDRQVTPVLKPGRAPGSVDVDLKVQDALPAHGGVEVNDRYTANTSRTRASVNLSFDNLFQSFHRLSLQYQTAPEEPDETRVLAATYIAPIANTGNILAVYAVDTNSDFASVGAIGPLSVLGSGRIYGARLIAMLPETGGYSHNFSFGGDYKDFADSILQPEGPADTTPIQYMHWTAQYSGTFRTEHTLTAFNVGPNFGIRGLGNDPEEFGYKRFKAKANYFYLSADAQHERPLLWGTRAFVRIAGQYTTDPLISNEQFAAGGADSVRGYLESAEMGDNGAYGTLELRMPQLSRLLPESLQQSYAFVFYDAAVLGILDPLTVDGEKDSRNDIRSWGAGLRWNGFGLSADLDWAYPLRDTDHTLSGDSRVHFRLRYDF